VEYIEVDVSSLNEIDDIIHARDIQIPLSYTLITEPDEGIAKVAATRAEVAEVAVEAEAAAPAQAPAEAASESSAEE
jgi:hypothetical protein